MACCPWPCINNALTVHRPLVIASGNGAARQPPRWQRSVDQGKYFNLRKGNYGDEPFRNLPGAGKFYLDEMDVITLLDPPGNLKPFSSDYSPAAYLWKKIDNIPQERRPRLLELVRPHMIVKAWEIADLRYDKPTLFKGDAFTILPAPEIEEPFSLKHFEGKVSGGVWPLTWIKGVSMDFFVGNDNAIYGLLSCYGLLSLATMSPLYFKARAADCVPATGEHCDLVLEFGDGQLHLTDAVLPSFSKPAKTRWPFAHTAVYVRPVGPGVLVGQLWTVSDPGQAPPRNLASIMLARDSGS